MAAPKDIKHYKLPSLALEAFPLSSEIYEHP